MRSTATRMIMVMAAILLCHGVERADVPVMPDEQQLILRAYQEGKVDDARKILTRAFTEGQSFMGSKVVTTAFCQGMASKLCWLTSYSITTEKRLFKRDPNEVAAFYGPLVAKAGSCYEQYAPKQEDARKVPTNELTANYLAMQVKYCDALEKAGRIDEARRLIGEIVVAHGASNVDAARNKFEAGEKRNGRPLYGMIGGRQLGVVLTARQLVECVSNEDDGAIASLCSKQYHTSGGVRKLLNAIRSAKEACSATSWQWRFGRDTYVLYHLMDPNDRPTVPTSVVIGNIECTVLPANKQSLATITAKIVLEGGLWKAVEIGISAPSGAPAANGPPTRPAALPPATQRAATTASQE